MILTGTEIEAERAAGRITIEPFSLDLVNPNSYNYRLGQNLLVKTDSGGWDSVVIPPEGYVLNSRRLYLGSTYEKLGSKNYAMSLIGRSSIGRLGLFLQVSANLGHVGAYHSWTLELVAAQPIRVYPLMRVGQISFWSNEGIGVPYTAGYSRFDAPTASEFESLK
jgi:dCTP deaminase